MASPSFSRFLRFKELRAELISLRKAQAHLVHDTGREGNESTSFLPIANGSFVVTLRVFATAVTYCEPEFMFTGFEMLLVPFFGCAVQTS